MPLCICFLADSLKSSGSVKNYVSGVKTWSTIFGYDSSKFYSIKLWLTISGMEKANEHIPQPKLPVWPSQLKQLHGLLNFDDMVGIVFRSMITIAYFAMLRKSQFANVSVSKFKVSELFLREDFHFTSYGLQVNVKWNKSDQKHASSHFIALLNIPESVLCPIKAYADMVTLIPALPSEPAFGLPNKSKLRPFLKSQIHRKSQGLIKSLRN